MDTLTNDPDRLQALVDLLGDAIRSGRTPEAAAKRLLLVHKNAEEVELALKAYQEKTSRVRQLKEPNTVLDNGLPAPWYIGPRDDDLCWPALEKQLISLDWERHQPGAIASIDNASTRILSLLPHPGTSEFSTRGLVMGYVQSGKTANLTSVIAKAADSGYRVFLILSGLTTVLRKQTQLRVERDLTKPTEKHWLWLTGPDEDFWMRADPAPYLSENQNARVIGVIKKNKTVLTKLRKWLGSARKEIRDSCPILVIDDEADQASPNASGKRDSRTVINELIIDILQILPRSAYIGYTATPFANLLIDTGPEYDLYPRDFITDLPKPASYFGPERIFGRDPLDGEEPGEAASGLDMIRKIEDGEIPDLRPTSANKRTFQPKLTQSLEEALRYFVVATAARWARGDADQHSTMLVHSSEAIAVHQKFEKPLRDASDDLSRKLAKSDSKLLGELRVLWEREQSLVPSEVVRLKPVPFAELLPHLAPVAGKIDIRLEYGGADKRLSYEDDPPGGVYIVIGGNVVSRGLTLEGLVVTHFVRSASAYDTLLQMGRWFGFRVGYEDLPRVWLPDTLKGFFRHLALVEREIRYAVDRYKDGALTPKEFAVRIRSHPIMAVTSRLKMVHARSLKVSFAGKAPQTILFRADDGGWLDNNRAATENLVKEILSSGGTFKPTVERSSRVAYGVASEYILTFLEKYEIVAAHAEMPQQPMRDYIRAQNRKGRLKNWNVAIVGTENAPLGKTDLGLGDQVPLINRSAFGERPDGLTDIRALMSSLDILVDIDVTAEELAEAETRPSRLVLREQKTPDTGLLLLYPISKDSTKPKDSRKKTKVPSERRDLAATKHVIGLGLVFPDPKDNTPQNYVSANLPEIEWDDSYEEDEVVIPDDDEPLVEK